MKASQTELQRIIEGNQQYIIPLFQRPYSWQKPQWEQLWNDIMELSETDHLYPHFLGSIVTMQTDSPPQGVAKYFLIDGQQRLTTIFMILASLRDQAKIIGEEELVGEISDILVNRWKKDNDHYKLQPTKNDQQYFYAILKPTEDNDYLEQDKRDNYLYNSYLFFQRKVKKFDKTKLQEIKNIICQNLIVVSIELGKDDNPYLVFESLNAKGQPLTQADLIRNYLLMGIESKYQDKIYKKYWLPVQNLLGENLTEFFRYYLTRKGIDVKKNEVYSVLKNQVDNNNIIDYLENIYKFAFYYDKFLNPQQEDNKLVKKYLQRIQSLDVSTVYPFMLNCYHDWQETKLTETEFIEVFKIIENYILRRFVCNIQTRGLNRIFAVLYNQVSKEANLKSISFLQQLKLTLQTQNYPLDIEFKEKLKEVKLYGSNRTAKARLILESIEEFYGHKEIISFDNLTIEHIMPQKLSDWWKHHLEEDAEITHELLLHSLGNLTLTAYNSELSNDTFLNKQKELNNSNLELNKYFKNCSKWIKENIEERAEILAEISLKIWDYFGDINYRQINVNSLTGKRPKNVIIFQEDYPVKTWRDVLEITLNTLIELEPDKFEELVLNYPRFIAKDPSKLRSNRELKNGMFFEVNLGAKDIYSFCQKIIETCELSSDDWQIEMIS